MLRFVNILAVLSRRPHNAMRDDFPPVLKSQHPIPHDLFISPMKGVPNPSDTFIQTPHHSPTLHSPDFFPIGIPQHLRLLQDLLFFQIPHTDHFLPPVDVLAAYNGMTARPRRDVDLNLRVGACESGEEGGAEELAGGGICVSRSGKTKA